MAAGERRYDGGRARVRRRVSAGMTEGERGYAEGKRGYAEGERGEIVKCAACASTL